MITTSLRRFLRPVLLAVGRSLVRARVRPWQLTIAPPAVSCGLIAPLLAGRLVLVGVAVAVVVLPLDAIDGTMARSEGAATTRRGHYVDVMADRVRDVGLWCGTIVYAIRWGTTLTAGVCVVAVAAWTLSSQSTLLVEATNAHISLGPVQRTERLLLLLTGLVLAGSGVPLGLTVCAGLLVMAGAGSVALRAVRAYRDLSAVPASTTGQQAP